MDSSSTAVSEGTNFSADLQGFQTGSQSQLTNVLGSCGKTLDDELAVGSSFATLSSNQNVGLGNNANEDDSLSTFETFGEF